MHRVERQKPVRAASPDAEVKRACGILPFGKVGGTETFTQQRNQDLSCLNVGREGVSPVTSGRRVLPVRGGHWRNDGVLFARSTTCPVGAIHWRVCFMPHAFFPAKGSTRRTSRKGHAGIALTIGTPVSGRQSGIIGSAGGALPTRDVAVIGPCRSKPICDTVKR
jgi:hypothetical protein